MLITRNMIVSLLVASMLALLISIVPMLSKNNDAKIAPVFQTIQATMLDKRNIVDLLSTFQTHEPLSHVNWQNNNLFLDFKVDPSKPIYVDDIYEDLYKSVEIAYLLTHNVQGLYVRVIYSDKGNNEVLIALSTERSKEMLGALGQHPSIDEMKAFLSSYTTISYGVLWKEKIQN